MYVINYDCDNPICIQVCEKHKMKSCNVIILRTMYIYLNRLKWPKNVKAHILDRFCSDTAIKKGFAYCLYRLLIFVNLNPVIVHCICG